VGSESTICPAKNGLDQKIKRESIMEKLNLKVNGTCYEVEVGDLADCPVKVLVNGNQYFVEVEGTAVVTRPVVVAAPVRPAPAPVTAPAPAPVAVAPAPAPAGNGSGGADIRAPMPGIIHDVAVKPGDQVKVGQQVLALEAMKMKSAIRATADGVVSSVEVSEGQRVAFGQVLIRFA
jgi:biotin carboxyl carrier protein